MMAKRRANDVVVAQKATPKPSLVQVQQEVANATTVASLRQALARLVALLGAR